MLAKVKLAERKRSEAAQAMNTHEVKWMDKLKAWADALRNCEERNYQQQVKTAKRKAVVGMIATGVGVALEISSWRGGGGGAGKAGKAAKGAKAGKKGAKGAKAGAKGAKAGAKGAKKGAKGAKKGAKKWQRPGAMDILQLGANLAEQVLIKCFRSRLKRRGYAATVL